MGNACLVCMCLCPDCVLMHVVMLCDCLYADSYARQSHIDGRLSFAGEAQVDAHALLLTCCVAIYMGFPFGMSTAATIRVGNLVGANRPAEARLSGSLLPSASAFYFCLLHNRRALLRRNLALSLPGGPHWHPDRTSQPRCHTSDCEFDGLIHQDGSAVHYASGVHPMAILSQRV